MKLKVRLRIAWLYTSAVVRLYWTYWKWRLWTWWIWIRHR